MFGINWPKKDKNNTRIEWTNEIQQEISTILNNNRELTDIKEDHFIVPGFFRSPYEFVVGEGRVSGPEAFSVHLIMTVGRSSGRVYYFSYQWLKSKKLITHVPENLVM